MQAHNCDSQQRAPMIPRYNMDTAKTRQGHKFKTCEASDTTWHDMLPILKYLCIIYEHLQPDLWAHQNYDFVKTKFSRKYFDHFCTEAGMRLHTF